MLEYFFFFLDAKKPIFIFVPHCFMQIYISLSTDRILSDWDSTEKVSHIYGTLSERY